MIDRTLVALGAVVVQVSQYMRRKSKYEILQDSFEDVSRRLGRMLDGHEGPGEQVLSLLDIGDVLLPQVRARFWRRFAFLLGVGLASGAAVAAVAEAQAGAMVPQVVAVVVVAGNWILAVPKFLQRHLLSEAELNFLKNLALLQDRFYREVVVESIEKFNHRCGKLLHRDRKRVEVEWKALLAEIDRALQPTLPARNNGPGGRA